MFADNLKDSLKTVISIFTLFSCGIILLLICRFRPLLGDDILDQFMYCDKMYIGDPTWVELPPKDSIAMVLKDAWHLYNHWSGRVIYLLLIALPTLAGKTVYCILTAIIYMGIIFAGGKLEYGSISALLKHPVSVVTMSSLIMLYNYTMDHSIMWTFASIYGMSVFLYLILLNYTKDIADGKKEINTYTLIGMNILGLATGLTHELLGAWYIFQILLILVFYKGIRRAFGYIKLYIGLILGFGICFFAPGNFERALSDHDSNIYGNYFLRLFESASQHGQCILKMQNMGIVIGLTFLFLVLWAFIKTDKHSLIDNIARPAFYAVSILASWVMWSLVAYTPVYGMIGMLVYVCLLGIHIIDGSKLFETGGKIAYDTALATVMIVLVLGDSIPWLAAFGQQSIAREELISEAKAAGEEYVIVPKYTDYVSRHIIFSRYVNNSSIYAEPAEMKYYGIRIIVE